MKGVAMGRLGGADPYWLDGCHGRDRVSKRRVFFPRVVCTVARIAYIARANALSIIWFAWVSFLAVLLCKRVLKMFATV